MSKTNILQQTVNMLSLKIYPSLHCVVAFKKKYTQLATLQHR